MTVPIHVDLFHVFGRIFYFSAPFGANPASPTKALTFEYDTPLAGTPGVLAQPQIDSTTLNPPTFGTTVGVVPGSPETDVTITVEVQNAPGWDNNLSHEVIVFYPGNLFVSKKKKKKMPKKPTPKKASAAKTAPAPAPKKAAPAPKKAAAKTSAPKKKAPKKG